MIRIRNRRVYIWRLVAMLLITPVLAVAVIISGSLALDPFLDSIDQAKVVKMAHKFDALSRLVGSVSKGWGDFTAENKCTPDMNGWQSTGDYMCITSLSIVSTVESAGQAKLMHENIFPAIDKFDQFKAIGNLVSGPSGTFGNKYIGSTIDKQYEMKDVGATCSYSALLSHLNEPTYGGYGAEIQGRGRAKIDVSCGVLARGNWL